MQALHRTQYFDVEQGAPEHDDTDPERSSEILRNQSPAANFAIDQKSLGGILDANNIEFLHQYGGVEGIASALKSNLNDGIKGDDQDLQLRLEVFGSNQFVEGDEPEAATKTYSKLALESAKETTTILLLCYATLSVALGVLNYGVVAGWCDGAMTFFVVFISFFVKLYKERTRRSTSSTIAKNNLAGIVDVRRDGQFRKISSSQVTVGEIVLLKTGDRVPADGLFIRGSSSFKLDEDEDRLGMDYYRYPVIHAGTEVVIGDCCILVITVGKNTRWSKTMDSGYSHRESRLLLEVDKLSANMEKIVLGLSLVLLVVQLLCYLSKKTHSGNGHKQNEGESKTTVNTSLEEIMNEAVIIIKKNSGIFSRLIAIVGVVLMGVREGLSLGIFITFLYSKRKLKFDQQAIVTNVPACATIGLVSTIYTSETDDLALKQTSMADLWIGEEIVKEVTTELTHELLNALREGVGLSASGPFGDAFLCWAKLFLGVNMEELVRSCTILYPDETSNDDVDGNSRGLSLRRNGENGKNIIHMHWRGPPEIVLPMCSDFYTVDGQRNSMDVNKRIVFEQICKRIATECIHCIAFAYKQVVIDEEDEEEEEEEEEEDEDDDNNKDDDNEEVEDDDADAEEEEEDDEEEEEEEEEEPRKLIKQKMTLLGVVGLKSPYPEKLKQAIKDCREGGVNITLMLGHDMNTARFMGINSGVLTPNDDISKAVVEASEIRNIPQNDDLTQSRRRVDDIRVLANCSPSDQLLLLQHHRQQTAGKVLAVTGGNSRDTPAFNASDVGFWIGDGRAKAAEERSDIIILDRSFMSIAAVLRQGRFTYQNMQKFIQLHLTINMVGVAVNFIAAIPSGNTPLSAIQLVWVGLITDTLGSFALSTDPETIPVTAALPPVNSSLTSKAMWRNVLVQVLYQTIILLMLHFKGKVIFHVDDQTMMDTMVFNTYVMCQVFGLLNATQIERSGSGEFFSRKSFSEKIYRNRLFVGTAVAIVVLHMAAMEILMVLINHNNKMRLDARKWLFSTGVAALSLAIGYVAKGIPVS